VQAVVVVVVLGAAAVVMVALVVAGYFRNQFKKDVMDVACDRYGGELRREFWGGNVKEGDTPKKTYVHGK